MEGADFAATFTSRRTRKLVVAWIQLKMRDADAYTTDELARFNAKKKSQDRFEPYTSLSSIPPASTHSVD